MSFELDGDDWLFADELRTLCGLASRPRRPARLSAPAWQRASRLVSGRPSFANVGASGTVGAVGAVGTPPPHAHGSCGVAHPDRRAGPAVRHDADRHLRRRGALHDPITEIRADTDGRAYYERKRAEGKRTREVLRCLKRRLSDVVYRTLRADQAAAEPQPASLVSAA
jgi:hypothetical protein